MCLLSDLGLCWVMFGKPEPDKLKRLHQQTRLLVYIILILFTIIFVQSNTQGVENVCPVNQAFYKNCLKGWMCSRNRMFDGIKNLWGNPESCKKIMGWKSSEGHKVRKSQGALSHFDSSEVFTVWYLCYTNPVKDKNAQGWKVSRFEELFRH